MTLIEKIKAGYKTTTRNGHRVDILTVYLNSDRPIAGIVTRTSDGAQSVRQWLPNGHIAPNIGCPEHICDLIAVPW